MRRLACRKGCVGIFGQICHFFGQIWHKKWTDLAHFWTNLSFFVYLCGVKKKERMGNKYLKSFEIDEIIEQCRLDGVKSTSVYDKKVSLKVQKEFLAKGINIVTLEYCGEVLTFIDWEKQKK